MAANPLCGRVHDDISAVVDGAAEVAACAEGVVYDEGYAGLVGNGRDLLKVGDVVFGVANTLKVDGFGVLVDGCLEVFGLVTVDEFGLDAEAGKEDLELVVCASVPFCWISDM